jgi:isocitrate dehydrogenase kinase/phosphatase
MHIDEVHKTIKRAINTTIKVANAGIEYYRQRIKELEDVIRSANTAASDEVLPRTSLEAEVQAALTHAVDAEINGNEEGIPNETIHTPGAMSRDMRRAAKDGSDV